MKFAMSSAALLLLVAVLAAATVGPAAGSVPVSACQECCSGAPVASCPRWCPPCRAQCPTPPLTSCGIVPQPPQPRCRSRACPRGQRCCFDGCRVSCQPVCSRPCPARQRCSVDPRAPRLARCVAVRPTCRRFPCPRGSRCVLTGGRPRCAPRSRPGTCPVNDLLPRILCMANTPDNCAGDSSCPEPQQKCCSYGCSRNCVKSCLPACRADQKCVLKNPPGPCLGRGCPPSTTVCQLKNPCSVVRCGSGSRCVVRDGEAKCEPPSTRPGFCPADDAITICRVPVNACTSDAQCSDGQKCCRRGCNRECLPACRNCRPGQTCKITEDSFPCLSPPCLKRARCVDDGPVTKPGVCPRNDIITTCQVRDDACSSDAQCDDGQKCCSRGCGRTCVSVCKKPCPSGKTCKITATPCFRPPCPEFPQCVKAEPVTKRGVCPRNDIITTCQVRKDACSSDAQCDDGQKCCSRGCGRACVSVCNEPCPSGKTCKITVFPCFIPPCPTGPRCVKDGPVTKPGVCPRNDIITTCQVRKDACRSDAQCDDGQKCCSRGCGRACVPVCKKPCRAGHECTLSVVQCFTTPCPPLVQCSQVGSPVARPGKCPPNNIFTICSVRRDACTTDAQCRIGQKCCSQGCGRRCVAVKFYKG